MPPSLSDRQFFAPLHGLRGIAVLYIILSHLGNSGLFLAPIPHDAIGKVGVWIFFSLSAFLLTTHLCGDLVITSSRTLSVLQYAAQRIFRIYPLYALVLIGHAALGNISGMEFLKHMLLLQGWGELWAIPVEFQCYVLIPVVAISVLYLRKRHVCVLLAAAVAASVYFGIRHPASVFSEELGIVPKLAPFLLGSILALLLLKKRASPDQNAPGVTLFISLVCVVGLTAMTALCRCLSKDCLSNSFSPWLSLSIGVLVSGLIYLALKPNFISALLGTRPLVFLGEVSFSVYLLHMFVIRFVTKFSNLPPLAEAWLSLGFSVLVAFASYRLIERPGIRLGKMIGQRLAIMLFRFKR